MRYQIAYDDGYRYYSLPQKVESISEANVVCQEKYGALIEFTYNEEANGFTCDVAGDKDFNAIDFTLFLLEDE
jgi:hypothetical protein